MVGLILAMKRLVTNVTLMSMSLAGSAETATLGIFSAFSVKYLQTQFGLSPGMSGTLIGKFDQDFLYFYIKLLFNYFKVR